MATLAVQKATPAGIAATLVAANGGGDQFPAARNRTLRVKNGGGSGITVTINSQRTCDQGFDHDLAIPVAAGAEEAIGGLDPGRFADQNGYVQVTYSGVTSVTVGVFET